MKKLFPITLLLSFFFSNCQHQHLTVYELTKKNEQLIDERNFEGLWDMCLSKEAKKHYNGIVSDMSKPDSQYYALYDFLDKLDCIDVKKMNGKDLYTFCMKNIIKTVEILQEDNIKGSSAVFEKLDGFIVYKFISKDKCISYSYNEEKKELINGTSIIRNGKGWKYDLPPTYNDVVTFFTTTLILEPNFNDKFSICE